MGLHGTLRRGCARVFLSSGNLLAEAAPRTWLRRRRQPLNPVFPTPQLETAPKCAQSGLFSLTGSIGPCHRVSFPAAESHSSFALQYETEGGLLRSFDPLAPGCDCSDSSALPINSSANEFAL